ncbi:iron ABC transporter substrate-binding protein [Bacteroidia bacterium]|nr:iron ABC transporter substrate-binding protein [Bacteroidia bacterium]
MKYVLFIIGFCLVTACGQLSKPSSPEGETSGAVRYAKGFTVRQGEGYIAVEVADPWDSTKVLQRYVLVRRDKPLPARLPGGTVIRTPIRRLAIYASVHAAMVEELGETESITGVCEPMYMPSAAIKEGVAKGTIADLGAATSPNVEEMMERGIECIIATPFQNAGYGTAGKVGIPIIEGADYMEPTPLGRAEWICFFGLLFNKEEKADSIFRGTEQRYLALKELAGKATSRPEVLSERKYGSSWYVPGNDSYIAHFFRDAGATNIFGDIGGAGSVPLAFEAVLDRAAHAPFWLLKYNLPYEMTCQDLQNEYFPYGEFDAFKNRNIFTCNTGNTLYYEESPIHPDYLLQDFIHIFHPGLLPGYTPRYYKKIEN